MNLFIVSGDFISTKTLVFIHCPVFFCLRHFLSQPLSVFQEEFGVLFNISPTSVLFFFHIVSNISFLCSHLLHRDIGLPTGGLFF